METLKVKPILINTKEHTDIGIFSSDLTFSNSGFFTTNKHLFIITEDTDIVSGDIIFNTETLTLHDVLEVSNDTILIIDRNLKHFETKTVYYLPSPSRIKNQEIKNHEVDKKLCKKVMATYKQFPQVLLKKIFDEYNTFGSMVSFYIKTKTIFNGRENNVVPVLIDKLIIPIENI